MTPVLVDSGDARRTRQSGGSGLPEVSVIGLIISMIIVGLIAGFLARAIVPGRQSMGIAQTILLGIVGSFIGGFLGRLLFGKDAGDGFFQPAGIIGAVIGAIIALLVYTRISSKV